VLELTPTSRPESISEVLAVDLAARATAEQVVGRA
jgi:hypothetical protein